MEPFVYAPASILGKWENIFFFKFYSYITKFYLKSINGAFLYTLQQACLVTGQTLSFLQFSSYNYITKCFLKPLIEPFVHAPTNMVDNGTNAKIGFLGGISKVIQPNG